MAKTKVIVIANQKGGVGKSTSVYNIGAGFSMSGKYGIKQKKFLEKVDT